MKLNILLLCNKPQASTDACTIVDHISAFEDYSQHQIITYSNLGDFHPLLDINRFDVVIVHYSMYIINESYLSNDVKKKLTQFNGLKVLFVQDEYRKINDLISEINKIQFDLFFTCFPDSEIERVYPKSKLFNLVIKNNLTGYVPEKLLKISQYSPVSERSVHVGYRSRKVPFWLGELGYEKWSIVDRWREFTKGSNLITDLSYMEYDRIYGSKWIEFLGSCKTVLGVESGASVMDFSGKLQTLVEFHQSTFPDDSFQEIQKIYLTEHEGKYKLNQISPRCFEAIAVKTVLVLYEGEYSGILVPGRHYIMLKKDFSNIDHVLSLINDDCFLQNMADVAHREIVENPEFSYQSFIKLVDETISSEFKLRSKSPTSNPYDPVACEFFASNPYDPPACESFASNPYDPPACESFVETSICKKNIVHDYRESAYPLMRALVALNRNKQLNFLKSIVTRKIRVFNPFLRRVKSKLIQKLS